MCNIDRKFNDLLKKTNFSTTDKISYFQGNNDTNKKHQKIRISVFIVLTLERDYTCSCIDTHVLIGSCETVLKRQNILIRPNPARAGAKFAMTY